MKDKTTGTPQEWRPVPGYEGAYEISWLGQIRSYRYKGGLLERPRYLHPFQHRKHGNQLMVKLTDSTGKTKEHKLMQLVVATWLGGVPEGKVPYHKNGEQDDNSVGNIGFTTLRTLGKKTGIRCNRRIPVAKIAPDGSVITFYPSAREAAKANYMSYQAVIDRCNGKVKKEFALDGYSYRWDR